MYKYWAINRPADEAYPPGAVEIKPSLLQEVQTSSGTLWTWGWLVYKRQLTKEECRDYELSPDDPVEWAHYCFWLYGDFNEENAEYYEQDFLEFAKSPNYREEHVPSELRKAIKILLGGE